MAKNSGLISILVPPASHRLVFFLPHVTRQDQHSYIGGKRCVLRNNGFFGNGAAVFEDKSVESDSKRKNRKSPKFV